MLLFQLAPTLNELVPWTDRRGRLHTLRAITSFLLLMPAVWLLVRWDLGMLGPRTVNTAIHSTGYWTIWLLIVSLCVTPARVLIGRPEMVVIRRMIGNASLLYALLHVTLYCADQNWRMWTVAKEIVLRFYLTIGFVSLVGLIVLGVTSTDSWLLYMGKAWKRLHRIVYGVAALGLLHYMLQSKLDVSAAIMAAGVFTWLMLWRLLPVGADRDWPPLLGITAAATVMTVAYEYSWYRFGTHINPVKVALDELQVDFGLHPAGQVLALGLAVTVLTGLNRIRQTPFGGTVWFTMLIYALGPLVVDSVALFTGWSSEDLIPGGVSVVALHLAWAVLLAVLGMARWRLRQHWLRRAIDGVWLGGIVFHLVFEGADDLRLAALCAAAAFAGVLVWELRPRTGGRRAAPAFGGN